MTSAITVAEVGNERAVPALDELYEAYAPMIHRRCRTLLGDEEEALDAVHDIYLGLERKLHTFRHESELTTWIYRVATNHCLNRIRRRRIKERVFEWIGRDVASESVDVAVERRRLIGRLMAALGRDTAQLFVYRFVDEMNQAEIAEVLGVTERTVRTRLKKGLARAQEIGAELGALEQEP